MAEFDDRAEEPSADTEDLESAYRRALAALETAETEVGRAFTELHDPVEGNPIEATPEARTDAAEVPSTVPMTPESPEPGEATEPRVGPLGILEAALFVGGVELTTKRLMRMFNGEFDADRIAGFVDRLNDQYAAEGRPYEVVFGEGGYRMVLREEFGDVRRRVFGMGPREVKLSQPALEMLSLVAYHQPINRATVNEHGGRSGMAMLRQLLRRELVEVDRDEADVRYRTTDRFLELFGIADLDELPRAVELEIK